MSAEIIHGDALGVMREMDAASVDLIFADPPYFRVKDEPWDRQWNDADAFLAWLSSVCEELRRVLKPNGSLYLCASPQMGTRVESVVRAHFRLLCNIRWRKPPFSTKAEMFRKEDLRSYFPASETILFAEQLTGDDAARDTAGYDAKCEEAKRVVFGDYLRSEMARAGVTAKQVAALFPSRTGGFTGCVSNWLLGFNCPTPEQYAAIRSFLGGDCLTREYEDLRREYEDLRRPFFADAFRPYTDVWDFATVPRYPGKHSCEKPQPLLRHVIATSSRRGDLALDPFCGSGSTGIAARHAGRAFIGVDASAHWSDYARARIADAEAQLSLGAA